MESLEYDIKRCDKLEPRLDAVTMSAELRASTALEEKFSTTAWTITAGYERTTDFLEWGESKANG